MKPLIALSLSAIVLSGCIGMTPNRDSGSLKVASWNIEHLAERDGEGCSPRTEADYARLRDHVRALDADVIAFQEVQNKAAAERVPETAIPAQRESRSVEELSMDCASPAQPREIPALSPRESECLLWVSRGKSSADIGQIVGLSPRTVDSYLEKTCAKLRVRTRIEAVAVAVRAGLIDPDDE